MITRERLRELFTYDDLTGRLVRKVCNVGEKPITNGVSKQGYLIRWVDKKCFTEHALVWIYHNGQIPGEIDHINRNKIDNRIENLRICDRSLNNANQGTARKNNTSGYKGVSWSKCGKWWAQIRYKTEHHNLGYYDTPEDAARAYNRAALMHFGDFAHLNDV